MPTNTPIPLTAGLNGWSPKCFEDIDGAPRFKFRDGTRQDKHDFHFHAQSEGLVRYSNEDIREVIVTELRRGFESDNLAHNITRLEALWHAQDQYQSDIEAWTRQCRDILLAAEEGEKPELPKEPQLEFDANEAEELKLMLDQVLSFSQKLNRMTAHNGRYASMYPRLILRMLLKSTTLGVKIERQEGLVSQDCCEELLEAIEAFAKEHGVQKGLAGAELLIEAQSAFVLKKDEEKNSSAPPSESSAQKSSKSGKSKSQGAGKSKSRTSTAKKAG